MTEDWYDIKKNVGKQIMTNDTLKMYLPKYLKLSMLTLQLHKIFYKNNIYYINEEYYNNINGIVEIIDNKYIEYYNINTKLKNEYMIIPKYASYDIESKILENYRLDVRSGYTFALDEYCFICKKKTPLASFNCSFCDKSFHTTCVLNYDPNVDMYCPSHSCSLCKKFIEKAPYNCILKEIPYCFKSYCDICEKYLKNRYAITSNGYLYCRCMYISDNIVSKINDEKIDIDKKIKAHTDTLKNKLTENINTITSKTLILVPKYANFNLSINTIEYYKKNSSNEKFCFVCKKSIIDLSNNLYCTINGYNFHNECIMNYEQSIGMNLLSPNQFCSICKKYTTKFNYQCNYCFYSLCVLCWDDHENIRKCPCLLIPKL